jgi:hypothetical protein
MIIAPKEKETGKEKKNMIKREKNKKNKRKI